MLVCYKRRMSGRLDHLVDELQQHSWGFPSVPNGIVNAESRLINAAIRSCIECRGGVAKCTWLLAYRLCEQLAITSTCFGCRQLFGVPSADGGDRGGVVGVWPQPADPVWPYAGFLCQQAIGSGECYPRESHPIAAALSDEGRQRTIAQRRIVWWTT